MAATAAASSTSVQEPSRPSYSTGSYWDDRYSSRLTNFDWFFNYKALQGLIQRYIDRTAPCLHIGCGNSTIQEGLVADGFVQVTNVDISPVVIGQMKQQHTGMPALQYRVSDCRSMPEFESGCFGACIDKGTLDAVLCCQSGHADTVRYLKEVDRVLMPGGVFLLISLGTPSSRTALLSSMGNSWEVQVAMLPKPMMYLRSEASLTGRTVNSSNTNDKDDPIDYLGPYAPDEASVVSKDMEMRDYFFAYLCRKPKAGKEAAAAIATAPADDQQQPGTGEEAEPGQPAATALEAAPSTSSSAAATAAPQAAATAATAATATATAASAGDLDVQEAGSTEPCEQPETSTTSSEIPPVPSSSSPSPVAAPPPSPPAAPPPAAATVVAEEQAPAAAPAVPAVSEET